MISCFKLRLLVGCNIKYLFNSYLELINEFKIYWVNQLNKERSFAASVKKKKKISNYAQVLGCYITNLKNLKNFKIIRTL